MLCPCSRHFILCLALVQPRKTHLDMTEKLLTGTLIIIKKKIIFEGFSKNVGVQDFHPYKHHFYNSFHDADVKG